MPTKSKSQTTIRPVKRRIPPLHPGEMLREEFMVPLGLSANALALAIHVPATRVSAIVNGRRGITADTALRLGQYFGTSAEFWINVQKKYELDQARDVSEQEVLRVVRPAPRNKQGELVSAARRSA